jgi:hypothetical protein
LQPALTVFFRDAKTPEPDRICTEGWHWGCLARHRQGRQTYYRLPRAGAPSARDLTAGLETTAKESVGLDLSTVNFAALEVLARTAHFRVSRGKLHAVPAIKKLGKRWNVIRDTLVGTWLRENSPPYRTALDTVESRHGTCIVHKNLLIARIRDLSLRVKIEKAITDRRKLRVLDEELIVFTPAVRRDVEKLVKKAGHVIKVVEST